MTYCAPSYIVYMYPNSQGREHYYRLGVRKYGQLWKSVGKNTIAVCQPTQINSMFSVFGWKLAHNVFSSYSSDILFQVSICHFLCTLFRFCLNIIILFWYECVRRKHDKLKLGIKYRTSRMKKRYAWAFTWTLKKTS